MARHGENRHPIYAPDGRTWYETAIAEAEKRGQLQAELEQCHAKSTCCCGDYVKDHGMGSGHSPVSMYDYALDNANAEIERLKTENESLKLTLIELNANRNLRLAK